MTLTAESFLNDLPLYYAEDRNVDGLLGVVAAELQRVEDFLTGFRGLFFPQNADDTYGTLSMWELSLGLPVAPVGATVEERRNLVVASYRKRNSGAGSDWVSSVTEAVGTTAWSHQENTPGDYGVTVYIPFAPGSFTAGQIGRLLRDITPAHLNITVGLAAGFLVDISQVDQEPIT